MPIGSQIRSRSQPTASAGAQSASKYVAERPEVDNDMVIVVPDAGFDDVLPDYNGVEDNVFPPKRLLAPSSDGNLEYFGAMASGRVVHTPPYSTNLVLHLFRSTQTHTYPIEERLALGASANSPFFSMRSSPSTSSVDEYNKLTLARRRPALNLWETVAVSNIQPRLKLMAEGKMMISLIQLEGPVHQSQHTYELWWNSDAKCYRLWKKLMTEYEFQLEIGLEGWNSLDERPQTGFLVARSMSGSWDETNDRLAILDFSLPTPQFLCPTAPGHQKLDLIMASMLTTAVVHTRRPKMISQTLASYGMAEMNASSLTVIRQRDRNVRVTVLN